MQGKPSQNSKIIFVAGAKDYTGGAPTAEWICMKNCERIRYVVNCGVVNASSISAAITFTQATSDGGTPAALAFTSFNKISGGSASTGGETCTATTAASTYTILPADAQSCLVFEFKASDLNRTSGYDWITINVASASSHAILYSITAEVFGMSYGPGGLYLS
jgi:hypothetical protein